MRLARSFLYVPANREKFLETAIRLPSDAFILDLEDSVPEAEKAAARLAVRRYAPRFAEGRVWVRTNGLDTAFAEADLEAVIGIVGLAGLFVPKIEAAEEVLRWDTMIAAREAACSLGVGTIKLVLSIESARGQERLASRVQHFRSVDRPGAAEVGVEIAVARAAERQ